MLAPVVMVVGTASSVGKSTLVTALCRIAARRGVRVAPFKAQNMSNNAAVTADGGEIGRSTAVQAEAAGIAPTTRMNPILIKPEGERRGQIIVEGRPWRSLDALDYWRRKQTLWEVVTRNLDALREQYDLVIAEGAGSPVELNLKAHDIVNMRVATYANARTLLVGDIDAGGIFAAMLGTLMLLEPRERELVRGLIVNRFRGDPALFEDGIRILEERGGVPVLGVVPWIGDLRIAEEDAVALERPSAAKQEAGLTIAVLHFPQIANFDDFDALQHEPGVAVRYVTDPAEIGNAAAVILPGTKHTLGALQWLTERGFDTALRRYGGSIAGICGGYQLLGRRVSDPLAVEGAGGDAPGLGLLPVETVFEPEKRTTLVHARSLLPWAADLPLSGYEIHMGRTRRAAEATAALRIMDAGPRTNDLDGCVSPDGRVWGCYLHGLFGNHAFRHAWLGTLGWQARRSGTWQEPYDQLADVVERHLDADQLAAILGR